jgi:hypothetical protein
MSFHGFLSRYVRSLSDEGRGGLYPLAREASGKTPRLREPLLLYALFSGKKDTLLKATRGLPIDEEYRMLLSCYDRETMEKALRNGDAALPREYRKIYRSYESVRNKAAADNHTKILIHARARRLQSEKQISNYRIYTDLGLNHGNLNAFLTNGDMTKVSLAVARRVLEYVEKR